MDIDPPNAISDAEILEHTHGEVRKLAELILAIPEWDGIEPSPEFLQVSSETIKNQLMLVYDFAAPIEKSMEQQDDVQFLKELKKGYESGELDSLHSRLEKIDPHELNDMRGRKLCFIALATFPNGMGFASFINSLRTNISQWFSICESVNHLKGISPASMEDDAVSQNTGLASAKSIFKKSSVKTLLSPIAAKMTDYPVYWEDLIVEFDLWGGENLEGSSDSHHIIVYPCTCACNVVKREKPPYKLSLLGKRVMRAIAHEFRHTQQHRLWDTDIPKVEWEAKNSPASPRDSTDKAMIEVYRNDPGEIDARQFANKFEDAFDEKFLRKIGRLALRYHRRHAKEYIQAMSDYYKSTGEKDSASSKQ